MIVRAQRTVAAQYEPLRISTVLLCITSHAPSLPITPAPCGDPLSGLAELSAPRIIPLIKIHRILPPIPSTLTALTQLLLLLRIIHILHDLPPHTSIQTHDLILIRILALIQKILIIHRRHQIQSMRDTSEPHRLATAYQLGHRIVLFSAFTRY